MGQGYVPSIAALIVPCLSAWLMVKLINHRRHFRQIPGPPSSWLFGNIIQFLSIANALPPHFHWNETMAIVADKYGLEDKKVFRMDLWPLLPPFIMVRDPSVATELMKKDRPKHPFVQVVMEKIVGKGSFVSLSGNEWRSLRSLFVPAFSVGYLTTAAATIIDQMQEFHDRVERYADSGERFVLQDFAQDVTFDVITQIVMGKNFHCQAQRSDIEHHLSEVVRTQLASNNPLNRLLIAFPLWYHSRKLRSSIGRELRERFKSYDRDRTTKRGRGAAIDWLLNRKGTEKLDPGLLETAVASVITLVVAGHDTTAGTISHLIAYLLKNPIWLERCRKEYDEVFGKDTKTVKSSLHRDTKLLNQLPITAAVIKETLRLTPQGIFPRQSMTPDETIVVDGEVIPLGHGAAMAICAGYIHRLESFYPDPFTFDPSRWMVKKETEQTTEAYRPFERSSARSCPGEQLAMLELKMLMLYTLREFDFELAYSENDPKAPEEYGGHAYQAVDFTAKPAGGVPVRVKRRMRSG